MSVCEFCRKDIMKGDEFILEGKYPSGLKIWAKSVMNWAPPEDYGRIYHKKCFIVKYRQEKKEEPRIEEAERKESERKKALIRKEGQTPSVPSRERSYV